MARTWERIGGCNFIEKKDNGREVYEKSVTMDRTMGVIVSVVAKKSVT